MAPRVKKQIDYSTLTTSELVWLVQVDDCAKAFDLLYATLIPVATRIAKNYARRYTWLDYEDISQEMLNVATIKRIVCGYRPGKATSFEKYAYFRLTFEAKDVLRCEDPLGIKWPQKGKGHYPEWHRLGDEAFKSFDIEGRKELDIEQRELLQLYESIEAWRSAFQACREPKAKRKAWPMAEIESQPMYGSERGQYWGNRSRRKAKHLTLSEWRKSRAKPKQLCFF